MKMPRPRGSANSRPEDHSQNRPNAPGRQAGRLSRLQKWVLARAYKNEHHCQNQFGKFDTYDITKREIYEDFFDIRTKNAGLFVRRGGFKFADPPAAKVKVVILSRSLKALIEHGYIGSLSLAFNDGLGQTFHLTDKGLEAAKCINGRAVHAAYILSGGRP